MADSNNAMTGKVCMVTGATAGIGRVTARELARRGASVILVGRNAQRGSETVAAIQRETGNATVSFIAADLSLRAGVHRLAQEFLSGHQRLHVLVNNAGGLFALRQASIDGIEMTLAPNYLGPFLLTHLLLDALKAAAPSRIVTVASEAHEDVDAFDFADPQAARASGLGAYPRSEWANAFYSLALPWAHPAFLQYARTKLANVLFTTELARRLAGNGVTANCLHPGVVASDFGVGNGPMAGSCAATSACAASVSRPVRRAASCWRHPRRWSKFPANTLSTSSRQCRRLPYRMPTLLRACGLSASN